MGKRIGFSNLTEESPFCVTVRESIEAAVAPYPDLELIVRDNAMDDEQALRHAGEFAAIPVDLAIIYHINERLGAKLGPLLLNKRIPVIAVDIPIPLAVYFGVPNQRAGELAGAELARWVQANWVGQVDKILALIEQRVLNVVRQRVDHAIRTFAEQIRFKQSDIFYLDCGNARALSTERITPILRQWSDYHHIVIVGFNEDSTLGALEAARSLKRDPDVAVIGQGADKAALDELRHPASRLIATTAYRPDTYGRYLIELALRMLGGEKAPRENFIPIDLFTPQNLPDAL